MLMPKIVIVTQSVLGSETLIFLSLKIRRNLGIDAVLGSLFPNNSLTLKLVLFVVNKNICQNLHFLKVNSNGMVNSLSTIFS